MAQTTGPAWFEARVDRSPEWGGCWIWTGVLTGAGYGQWMFAGRRKVYVHRWSHEYFIGPIPEGLQIDHVWDRGCRYRSCCNPAHLEAVTGRTNVLRGNTVPARNIAKTHCPRGHAYAGDNLYVVPRTGHRQCRACKVIHFARFVAAHAVASPP